MASLLEVASKYDPLDLDLAGSVLSARTPRYSTGAIRDSVLSERRTHKSPDVGLGR